MIYYRSKSGGAEVGLSTLRTLSLVSLVAYPAGALTLAWGDGPLSAVLGYGAILMSLVAAAVIMSARLQRIVGEQPDKLDEYELKLRARAMWGAYTGLSVLLLIGIIYLAIASDAGWWLPTTYDHFSGLFWGVFLYTSLLPSAVLAWQVDPADAAPEA